MSTDSGPATTEGPSAGYGEHATDQRVAESAATAAAGHPAAGEGTPSAAQRKRASWDEYFLAIARQVATRSTCARKHVGAVIVRDRRILATGYNGSLRGLDHCDDVGHLMDGGHCVRTVHAEANAIVQAAQEGVRLSGASIYVTASPCFNCFKLIANSGIRRIVFGEFYRDPRIFEFAKQLNMQLSVLDGAGHERSPLVAGTRAVSGAQESGAMVHDSGSDDR